MPVGIVKTKRDEELWEKAKEIARKMKRQGKLKGEFWAVVMGIFKKMKGGKKHA